MAFKSWDEWFKAWCEAKDKHKINGMTRGIGEDGYFFAFDRDNPGVLWTYDRYGDLEKFEKVKIGS